MSWHMSQRCRQTNPAHFQHISRYISQRCRRTIVDTAAGVSWMDARRPFYDLISMIHRLTEIGLRPLRNLVLDFTSARFPNTFSMHPSALLQLALPRFQGISLLFPGGASTSMTLGNLSPAFRSIQYISQHGPRTS